MGLQRGEVRQPCLFLHVGHGESSVTSKHEDGRRLLGLKWNLFRAGMEVSRTLYLHNSPCCGKSSYNLYLQPYSRSTAGSPATQQLLSQPFKDNDVSDARIIPLGKSR
jgi:hypothetical protein